MLNHQHSNVFPLCFPFSLTLKLKHYIKFHRRHHYNQIMILRFVLESQSYWVGSIEVLSYDFSSSLLYLFCRGCVINFLCSEFEDLLYYFILISLGWSLYHLPSTSILFLWQWVHLLL